MQALEPSVSLDTQQPPNIFDRAVSITVTFGGIGNSRKVSNSSVQVDADKDLISVSKKLLDSPELDAIRKLDGEIRKYRDKLCLPSMLKSGIYLLPIVLVPEVEEKLRDFRQRRFTLVQDFLASYSQRMEEAALRLREVFNPQDYRSSERVRAAFTFDWQYVTFSTPGKLKEISAAFFEQEQQKMVAKVAEATGEVRQVLRAAMQEMVSHMVERLTPGEDGKTKTFHKTSVENLMEFMRTFDARNITDDAQLKALVDQAGALLEGINPKALRDNDSLRAGVQSSLAEIKTALDTMIVEGGNRLISFDEE